MYFDFLKIINDEELKRVRVAEREWQRESGRER
jgi:hypothetical protein